jgi:membrane protease YdiL (CAAX protease family)
MNKLHYALIIWIVLTIVYGTALQIFKNFEAISLLYHVGLLLTALILAGTNLGLKIGNWKLGIIICLGFLGFVVARSFILAPSFAFGWNLTTFSLLFFAPVTEELFWRGCVMKEMLNSKMSPEGTIFTNGALFGLMHLPRVILFNEPAFILIQMIAYGFLFAFSYYFTKSTYYPIIMHIIQNFST